MKCRHFTGLRDDTCAAGQAYKPLRDVSKHGRAVWPCLQLAGERPAETVCPLRSLMTKEELEQELAERAKQVGDFLAKLVASICPHCDRKIEARQQAGRCQYAQPCGHRLGQVADHGEEE